MAATYSYADIISMIDRIIPSPIAIQYQGVICNMATELIWRAYDFKETVADLPPFYLVPNEQDIMPPMANLPADFHGFRQVRMCQYSGGTGIDGNTGTSGGGLVYKIPMTVSKDLQLTHVYGLPGSLSFNQANRSVRVFPRTPGNIGAPYFFIDGTYKKRPTLITNATMGTTFPFDDQYLPVFIEVFRWAFYAITGSDKAMNQYAVAMEAIQQMASSEGLNEGDVFIAPATSLVGSFSGFPMSGYYGIFG